MPIGINFTSMGLDVRFNLDIQRGSKHSACPLMNEIIKDRLRVLARGIVIGYLQHWRAFLAGTAIPDVLQLVRRRVRRATKPETSSTSFDDNAIFDRKRRLNRWTGRLARDCDRRREGDSCVD
jgi:hypothetical protein